MRVNKKSGTTSKQTTYEGGKARKISAAEQLRRVVCASMLFEDSFYESGEDAAKRIQELSKEVSASDVQDIIRQAKFNGKLRHTPLYLAANAWDKVDRQLLAEIFTRPDDITDYLALYWKDGKKPLKRRMRGAIKDALNKFDAYQLAKYKGSKTDAVKLIDLFNLVHPRPSSPEQSILFNSVVNQSLEAPDTWEVALSAGADKKETFTRLMKEKKLGGMAFFKNLRNMLEAGVPEKDILYYMSELKTDRLMPMNLFAAASIMEEHSVRIAGAIEQKLLDMVKTLPRLKGKTAIVLDTSGSMFGAMVGKSKFERIHYAVALATIIQGMCDDTQLIFFNTKGYNIKGKTGLAMAKEAAKHQGGTDHAAGLSLVDKDVDRVIMLTDEQSSSNDRFNFKNAYMINLAGYQNSIAYKPWVSISGFSEKVLDFISEYERLNLKELD